MKRLTNVEQYQSLYSESSLLNKITNVAKRAGINLIYAALILYYILDSDQIKTQDKAKIWGALGYFILPIDLIPDTIPVVGYSDDLVAILWALKAVSDNITPEIQSKAKTKLKAWFKKIDEEALDQFIYSKVFK